MKTSDQLKNIWTLNLPWTKLHGKNILITGASGLIGSSLIRALVYNPKKDYNVYAMGRSKEKLAKIFSDLSTDSSFYLLEGDVTQPLDSSVDFHYIINCASNANPLSFSSQPVETIKANILGVDNLLSYGIEHSIDRFLYVSSGEIYGEGNGNNFVESDSGYIDCINPRACYPTSKRAAENLCMAYHTEFNANIVIARPCHIYGPNFLPTDDRAYAQFLRNAINGMTIKLQSSGLLNRSWCYIVDCVSALLFILLKGVNGEAYNVSDKSYTIKQFAKAIADTAGVNLTINNSQTQERPIISRGVLDSSKLQKLGWEPKDTLQNNISSCIEELKSNNK